MVSYHIHRKTEQRAHRFAKEYAQREYDLNEPCFSLPWLMQKAKYWGQLLGIELNWSSSKVDSSESSLPIKFKALDRWAREDGAYFPLEMHGCDTDPQHSLMNSASVRLKSRSGVLRIMKSWVSFVVVMVLHELSVSAGLEIDIQSDFSCGHTGNLLCEGNTTTSRGGVLTLTPGPTHRDKNIADWYFNTVGMALYKEPLSVLNLSLNGSASFSTSFSFKMTSSMFSSNETNTFYPVTGDGMAFVMFDSSSWIGDPGEFLGIYSSAGPTGPKTLAVEFDTYQNSDVNDIDNNHVGVDVEGVKSRTARSASNIGLVLSGQQIFAWIDYNASESILEVRINGISSRPAEAFISYSLRLSDVFDEELVWVGFSGSTGQCDCHNEYEILDWSLSSTAPISYPFVLTQVLSPSPSPSPSSAASISLPVASNSSRANTVAVLEGVGGAIAVIVLLLFWTPSLDLPCAKEESDCLIRSDAGELQGVEVRHDYRWPRSARCRSTITS